MDMAEAENREPGGKGMAHLPENPTLKDLQHYLAEVCQERGWTKDTPAEKFVLFIEEVGELAKAMRKAAGLYEEQVPQLGYLTLVTRVNLLFIQGFQAPFSSRSHQATVIVPSGLTLILPSASSSY